MAAEAPPAALASSSSVAPVVHSKWLLRGAGLFAALAAAIGRVLAPGLRGNASEAVVVACDRVAAVMSYALALLLMYLGATGIYDLARRTKFSMIARIVTICGVGVVVALVIPSFVKRLPTGAGVALALTTSVVVLTGAVQSLKAAHTRAVAIVLLGFGVASLVRLGAWQLAVVAGEHASARLYDWARVVATIGVVFEGLGQLAAAAWLGTRTRVLGQVLSSVAVALAFIVTWGAAQGVHAGASEWQSVLHTSLGEVAGAPPPFGLGAIATFLVPSAILFAFVAAVQPGQLPAVTGALALTLIGRGAYDAPMRALAGAAGAVWLMMATSAIGKEMWRDRSSSPPASRDPSAPSPSPSPSPAPEPDAATGDKEGDLR
jgi:hypothetical protein